MKLFRLCYRKIIDIQSRKAWDKMVFDDTHLEFYMQAQRMDPDGKYSTFQELSDNVPGADQLHYLASTAAVAYIRQLKDVVPDIANAYGKLCLPFKNFRFEIVESHITDKMKHKIAIWFYSDPLTWIDTVNNQLLVAYGDQREAFRNGKEVETDMISLSPFLSISHITSIAVPNFQSVC
ncbi:hypothetical protein [Dyadobacter psychrotolerans]|uniref:Uncharacterized protein n=1 Tax=Dyadobacter psychrotolerans TaxID=2541721 RepID=A0A4R5D5R8_9BACT|nr:hypothetical protein [Dyadobacter psychrotolerans]TDE08829.1 hypothetical protein E0F88_31775 [Dyadobacter psychrotolerans]